MCARFWRFFHFLFPPSLKIFRVSNEKRKTFCEGGIRRVVRNAYARTHFFERPIIPRMTIYKMKISAPLSMPK